MSTAAAHARNVGARIGQAGALAVIFGLLLLVARVTPEFSGSFGLITAVGLLLLAGMLVSELLDMFGLPHLTGYIVAGVASGPYVLHLVDHDTVANLAPVNTLALSLIALAGGAELKVDLLRQVFRSLVYSTAAQTAVIWFVMSATFFFAARFIPFTAGLGTTVVAGVAALWGVVAVSRSPSATLGILAQLRPDGPVTRFSLATVMVSDIVVVVLLTFVVAIVRLMVEPGAELSLTHFAALGHELLGSVSLGTTIGLLLAAYLKLVGGQLLVVLVAMGFGLTEGLRYMHFDPLLTFMVAGFVVSNMSQQGHKLLHAIEETGNVVFVVFFATAGAHLDITLLKALWPFALLLSGVRLVATWLTHMAASRAAGDDPVVRRWGWSSLVSQAGLTIGIAVAVERAFPAFGSGFRALAIAVVAMNELMGPILFKLGLDRAGESGKLIEKRMSNPDAMIAQH